MALRNGILDGTIDCMASHHFPQDWDHKTCEFEYAKFGMNALESVFAAFNELFPEISNERLVNCTLNARNIFSIPVTHIQENAAAKSPFTTRKNRCFRKTKCEKQIT